MCFLLDAFCFFIKVWRFSTVFGVYGAIGGYLEKKWLFMAQKVAIYGAIGGYYGAIGGYLAL
ncbi:hypothetical protein [Prevotella sp.]|uniref:hypothetical protein n=1 Tax=Prevotella sp. TaxID=59823 RepID=UPI0025F7F625|nr:hypothetical protein [Prevotella sp.]